MTGQFNPITLKEGVGSDGDEIRDEIPHIFAIVDDGDHRVTAREEICKEKITQIRMQKACDQ